MFYTLLGIIWFGVSVLIAVKWYNKSAKNIIHLGSPIKRLLFSIWNWVLYLIVSLVIVAIALAVLMGILTVWGWLIGLISIVVIVVWVFLRKKR